MTAAPGLPPQMRPDTHSSPMHEVLPTPPKEESNLGSMAIARLIAKVCATSHCTSYGPYTAKHKLVESSRLK